MVTGTRRLAGAQLSDTRITTTTSVTLESSITFWRTRGVVVITNRARNQSWLAMGYFRRCFRTCILLRDTQLSVAQYIFLRLFYISDSRTTPILYLGAEGRVYNVWPKPVWAQAALWAAVSQLARQMSVVVFCRIKWSGIVDHM